MSDGDLTCTYNRQSRRRGRVAVAQKKARVSTAGEGQLHQNMAAGEQHNRSTATTPNVFASTEISNRSNLENMSLESTVPSGLGSFPLISRDQVDSNAENMQDWWDIPDINFAFDPVDLFNRVNSVRETASPNVELGTSNDSADGAGSDDRIMDSQQVRSVTEGDSPHSHRRYSEKASSRSSRSPQSSLLISVQNLELPSQHHVKYPVLTPILKHITNIITPSVACELLEAYFATSVGNIFQPSSPYLLGHIFKKDSFLCNASYRPCKPVLLASMLWVAAQAGERPFFGNDHNARAHLTQKLFDLVMKLLDDGPARGSTNAHPTPMINVWPKNSDAAGNTASSSSYSQTTGSLDCVITYLHLAVVICSSELKHIGTPWWHLAFQMAKDMKLNHELPKFHNQQYPVDIHPPGTGLASNIDPPAVRVDTQSATPHHELLEDGVDSVTGYDAKHRPVTSEQREERRRVWWLLYILDRHLALCYNSPLALKDAECQDLLLPMSDDVWQGFCANDEARSEQGFLHVERGPSTECTGIGMFNFFIAVSALLGQVIEFHHFRSHPQWRANVINGPVDSAYCQGLVTQVDAFGQSICDIELSERPQHPQSAGVIENPSHHIDSIGSHRSSIQTTELKRILTTSVNNQRRLAVVYGRYMMQILCVLIYGKWDLESMINDEDQWWSSSASVKAVSHAISASQALDGILEVDPDLSFSPNFFGIYLLHGAFVHISAATKFQDQAAPLVLKSCQTFSRAHEVCVVTFHNEYQVGLLFHLKHPVLTVV